MYIISIYHNRLYIISIYCDILYIMSIYYHTCALRVQRDTTNVEYMYPSFALTDAQSTSVVCLCLAEVAMTPVLFASQVDLEQLHF